MIFTILVAIIISQRSIELAIAKSNEKWMKERGAVEVGQAHYPFIVILHIMFFVSFILEVAYFQKELSILWPIWGILFVGAQLLRIWAISSLGRFWNTKIIVLKNVHLITSGPYKYIRHPNYVVVAIEFFVIPMLFHAFITAFMFSILNALMMLVRIPAEEEALLKETNNGHPYYARSRFTPQKQ